MAQTLLFIVSVRNKNQVFLNNENTITKEKKMKKALIFAVVMVVALISNPIFAKKDITVTKSFRSYGFGSMHYGSESFGNAGARAYRKCKNSNYDYCSFEGCLYIVPGVSGFCTVLGYKIESHEKGLSTASEDEDEFFNESDL